MDAAAATALGTEGPVDVDVVETWEESVTGSACVDSVEAFEAGCVTVACPTTCPAVSSVTTTSTFTMRTLALA